jgi:hypothetical protein
MTTHLRLDQCCEEPGCTKPARRGDLCVGHYMAASPAARAVCDLMDRVGRPAPTEPLDTRAVRECCALEDLYELPAWGEAA